MVYRVMENRMEIPKPYPSGYTPRLRDAYQEALKTPSVHVRILIWDDIGGNLLVYGETFLVCNPGTRFRV